jgi:Recombinase
VLEPAEKELIEETATRVLRGESLRSIAMDWNERGVKTVGGGTWQGSMIRRVLMSPRIADLKEHRGEIVGKATWPAIIDRATHDRLVGLLGDESRRPANYGRPRVHPLAGLLTAGPAADPWSRTSNPGRAVATAAARTITSSARGASASLRSRWRPTWGATSSTSGGIPKASRSRSLTTTRMARIREITDEMRHLQEQKNEALRMKLRVEVDAKTFREVTAEIDAAHDQLAREHKGLASEAAMPELPDPSLAWEDLSAEDRRTLTEMLVDKIVIAPHPHKIDQDGRRHYLIRAIPYQDPEMEAERLKAVHEARVKIVPRI